MGKHWPFEHGEILWMRLGGRHDRVGAGWSPARYFDIDSETCMVETFDGRQYAHEPFSLRKMHPLEQLAVCADG